MARFVVKEKIGDDDRDGGLIWDRLRQYLLEGRTVELVDRVIDGKPVVEVRMWDGKRADGSNLVSASEDQDY